ERGVEILGLQDEVAGAASIRWAMHQSFCRTAGTTLILHSGSQAASFRLSCASIRYGCASKFQSQRRPCVDLYSGIQAASFQVR
ncbi:hypothetical protein NDU88_006387, partial [Pleurodeles waltl]